ncbi:MAG: undecaprenyl-phosphate glucose phosphotransferase [Acidobacteriota bacterium]
MIKKQRKRLIGLFILSDIISIIFAYFYSYGFRFYGYIIPVSPEKGIPPLKSYVAVFPLFLAAHLIIFFLQGFYRSKLKRTKIDDFFMVVLNTFLTIVFILAVLNYLYAYSQGRAPLFQMTFKISHGFLAVYFVVVVFLVSFLRNQIYFYLKRRFAKGLDLQNVLIVGAGEMGKTIAQKFSVYKDLGFRVIGFLDDERKKGDKVPVDGGIEVLGGIKDLEEILETVEISDVCITLGLNNYPQILEVFQMAHKQVVNVRLVPDLFQLLTLKAKIEDLDGFPVISIDEPPMRGVLLGLKKVSDVIISFILIVLLLPLMGLIVFLIKLTSKGPVLYHQERVGLDGKKFMIHKFRTMIYDAEKETGPIMCSPDDPRIIKFGRMLRKFSLDELPQLFNVLKGEMSLVGPRPERPSFVKDFSKKIPKYMLRHKVKSGITGWAQIHGLRQDTPIDKRIEYDFYYIQNWSFALDFKILWKTLKKGFVDKRM